MKVRLREIREDDLPFLNQCRNKYAVSKDLNLFLPQSMKQEHQWLIKPKDEIHFLIEINDDQLVGQVSLVHFSHRDKKAELTIFLDDEFWGNGYGKIATQLMLHYGFTELNLHKIYLHVYESNERAKKMYESLGFLKEGTLRDFIFKGGQYISADILGILAHEFVNRPETDAIDEPLLYFDNH